MKTDVWCGESMKFFITQFPEGWPPHYAAMRACESANVMQCAVAFKLRDVVGIAFPNDDSYQITREWHEDAARIR